MEKLKSFCKKHIISIIGSVVVILILVIGYLGCGTDQLQQTVTTQQTASNTAVQQAANAQNAAVNASIERQVEDGLRNKVITPKLDDARRRSQNSKTELKRARQQLNETTKNLYNTNASRIANCAELERLHPDTRFEYCHD
jgi:predicted negative regulator of RcsB-dependent stress response